jgi:P-type Cu+ transporter
VVDPVCNMTVSPETAAAAWEYQGQTHYFCSLSCFDRFKQEPQRYLEMDPSERHM